MPYILTADGRLVHMTSEQLAVNESEKEETKEVAASVVLQDFLEDGSLEETEAPQMTIKDLKEALRDMGIPFSARDGKEKLMKIYESTKSL